MDKKMSVTIDIGANISQIRAAAIEAQKILGNIGADPKGTLHLKNMLSDLEGELDKLELKSGKALTGLGDTKSVSSNIDRVGTLLKNITREIEKVGLAGETGWAKLTEGLAGKMATASSATNKYNKVLKDTERQYKALKKAADDAASARDKLVTLQNTIKELRDALRGRMNLSRITNSEKPLIKAQEAALKWAEEHLVRLNLNYTIKASDQEKLSQEQLKEYGKILDEVTQKQERFNEIKKDQLSAKSEYDKYTKDLENLAKEEETARNQVELTLKALEVFNKTAKDAAAFEELKKSLSQTFGDETFKNVKNLDELNEKLNKLASSASGEVKTGLLLILEMINLVSKETPKMNAELDKGRDALTSMGNTSREIEHLTSRLKYFFSLAGGFLLMRRAIRSAITTTKELDAAMTLTAVVSTKTVSLMWKTLPLYSAEAKKLGSTIVDVYKAQTLYVQQGLDMNNAMDLGVETLKMARVAGIDAAEATNSMTAALRGFNMELNETSATRINDVYSKLAQNTASNVQEISTAMTKTAALANSANMSFENTAAFLATIIESTREGAETAGTALKTVIARFTEVKKLYSEGELTGTDEEGQEVDVNKISKALRTAGINMNDFFTGTKGLDEIFMELGSKWNSLTTVQLRYIATMAAGSRQQSRFLALMQNYSRTVELTLMAYNSAGSGQEQFEKTLDSLEAKINKLKDEWQTFIMGLANNEAIKFFVDAGTTILSTINKIIDAISGGNGLVKAIASLATVFGVFKGGRALLKGAIGGSGTYGIGGIIGSWLGIQNGQAERQQKAAAFRTSMRKGGIHGQRTDYLRNLWFGSGGVLNPKGRLAKQEAAARAEAEGVVAAKYDAYKAAEKKELAAYDKWQSSQGDENGVGRNSDVIIEENEAKYDEARVATELAKVDYEKSQLGLKNVETSATNAGTALYQYGQAAKTAGMAAGVAGGLCLLLATALDKAGNTKAAKTFRIIGTTLSVLSGVFMVVGLAALVAAAQVAAEAAEASAAIEAIPIIGWIAAVIAGLIALGSIIATFVESDAEKLARLAEETEKAKEAADSATLAYEDLLSAKSGYDELVSLIKELTKGTIEYKNALYEANEMVLELAKNHPELKYTYNSETGLLEIDEESWKKVQENLLNRKKDTAAIVRITESREEKEKTDQNLQNLRESYDSHRALSYREFNLWTGRYEDKQFYVNLIDGFTDSLIIALLKLGLTQDDLYRVYALATNLEEKTYGELTYGMKTASELDILEILENYKNSLLNLIGDATSVIEDPYKKFDKDILEALYISSDQEKTSSLALSKLYGINSFKDFESKKEGQWYLDEDWNRKVQGADKTIWETILQDALEEGFINEEEAFTYKYKPTDNITNKKLYAAITGKTYDEVKDLDIKAISNYLGDYFYTKLAAKLFGIDQTKFENLDLNVLDSVVNLVSNTGELTLELLNTLLKEDGNDIKGKLKELGIDEDILNEYLETAEDLKDKVFDYEIESIKEGNEQYLTQKIQRLRKQIGKSYGAGYLGSYDNVFNAIASSSNLTNELRKTALNIFSATDITSLKDIWGVLDDLKEAGIDLETLDKDTYNALVDFAKLLELSGIAVRKWTEEGAKEAIKNARGIANEKKESLSRIFTKEQYEAISELLKGTEYSDELGLFAELTDNNYKYVGADLDTIIGILYTIAGKIPGELVQTVQARADLALKARGVYTSNERQLELLYLAVVNSIDDTRVSLNRYENTKNKFFATDLGKLYLKRNKLLSELHGLPGEEFYDDILKDIDEVDKEIKLYKAKNYNEQTRELVENEYKTSDQQSGFYDDTINQFLNSGLISDEDLWKAGLTKEATADTIDTLWPILLDILFNPEGLEGEAKALREKINLTGEENVNNLSAAAMGWGEYDLYDEESKLLADSTLSTMIEESSEASAIYHLWEAVSKKVEGYNEDLRESQTYLRALAQLGGKFLADTKKIGAALKDPLEKFKKAKENTVDWLEAALGIREALKPLYGNVSNEWIKKNQTNLEKLLKGGKEAEDAGRELAKEYIEGIKNEYPEMTSVILENMLALLEYYDTNGVSIPLTIDQQFDTLGAALAVAEYLNGLPTGVLYTVKALDDGSGGFVLEGEYTGFSGFSAGAKSGGGGGGGGGKKEFKNDFDKYYNMVEDINELTRLRNLLETDYDQLLKSEAATGKQIYDNLKQQIKLLQERRDITADLAEKRKQQIIDETKKKENKDLQKYAWWNETDNTIEIDWDKINKVKDSELGDRIKEYVKTLEDFQSKYDEQIEALEDIESTLQEIEKRGRDQYTSLEDRVRDALIKQIQDKIDELSATDEGINTANQKLLDSITKTLEKQRQERDNAKTEEELADKELHLAYLRQDSSNANALEIAKLEEELADARQSYTDSLIDLKISELLQLNDEAAELRQEQIDLLLAQLDWQEKNGEFWDQVYALINDGVDELGQLVHGSELQNLLQAGEAWDSLSQEGKMTWLSELETMVAEAVGYLYLSRLLETLGIKKGTLITFTNAEGKKLTGIVDKKGNVVVDNGDGTTTIYKDVYLSYDGTYHTLESEEDAKKKKKKTTNTNNDGKNNGNSSNEETVKRSWNVLVISGFGSEFGVVDKKLLNNNSGLFKTEKEANDEVNRKNRQALIKIQEKINAIELAKNNPLSNLNYTEDELENLQNLLENLPKYKIGGLNTKTGPAWLDGTPSRPELVLNARDTQNFIQLKDTLADLRKNPINSSGAGGDNYYDIDVHVDEIGSDYDVDRLADRLKTLIYKDGLYRNVNVLNRLR